MHVGGNPTRHHSKGIGAAGLACRLILLCINSSCVHGDVIRAVGVERICMKEGTLADRFVGTLVDVAHISIVGLLSNGHVWGNGEGNE